MSLSVVSDQQGAHGSQACCTAQHFWLHAHRLMLAASAGGKLNTCYNAVDAHVNAGRGDQPALVYDSAITGEVRTYTYKQLQDATARLAGALQQQGVVAGDTVIIYMPMVPEAAIAMLACARIGAIHSVVRACVVVGPGALLMWCCQVFGGFAAHELAVRIDDATPKVIMSASCGLEGNRVIEYKPLLDEAIRQASHKPDSCIMCVLYGVCVPTLPALTRSVSACNAHKQTLP